MQTTIDYKYPLNIEGLSSEQIKRQNPNSKYAHITCTWKQKVAEGVFEHQHTFLINCQTLKVYNDDSKGMLGMKFCMLPISMPIFTAIKTIYHTLIPLSVGMETSRTLKKLKLEPKESSTLEVIKAISKNCLDILRTPLYGTVMTIVPLATLVLSPLNTEILYDGRAIFGQMQMSLNWGEKHTTWTLAPCMQPLADLNALERKKFYEEPDTIYDGGPGTKIHGLNNLVRSLYANSDTQNVAIDIPEENANDIPEHITENATIISGSQTSASFEEV